MKNFDLIKLVGLSGVLLVIGSGCATSGQLIKAARHGDADKIDYLVGRGVDVNSPTDRGSTALHYATSEAAVDALVRLGGNVNQGNLSGNTPLHCAVQHRSEPAIAALIRHGAKVNAENYNGDTPLHLAVLASMGTNVIQRMLDAGANMYLIGRRNVSALDLAFNNASPDMFSLMVQRHFASFKGKSRDEIVKVWGEPIRKETGAQGDSVWAYEVSIKTRPTVFVRFGVAATQNFGQPVVTSDDAMVTIKKAAWRFVFDKQGNCSGFELVGVG